MYPLAPRLLVVLLAAFPAAEAAAQSFPESGVMWSRYHHPQSGVGVDYPTSVFSTPAGAPRRGTGHRFVSRDGRAMLSIYSLQNDSGESPRSFVRRNIRSDLRRVDYERVTGRFLALSAVSGGRIHYTRCNFARLRSIHCFEVAYPAGEKRAWDAVVTRMSHSLVNG